MRKHAPIIGFVLVALFAMSCFTPPTNAVIYHGDLRIWVYIDGNDIEDYHFYNPYEITAGERVEIDIAYINYGPDVTISDVVIEFWRDMPWGDVLVFRSDPMLAGYVLRDGGEVTLPFDTRPEYEGQEYEIVVSIDFETLDRLNVFFWIKFKDEPGGACLGTIFIAFVSVATLVSYSLVRFRKKKKP